MVHVNGCRTGKCKPFAGCIGFKHTKCYTQATFSKEWNQTTENSNTLAVSSPKLHHQRREHKRIFPNKCAELLFKCKCDDNVKYHHHDWNQQHYIIAQLMNMYDINPYLRHKAYNIYLYDEYKS